MPVASLVKPVISCLVYSLVSEALGTHSVDALPLKQTATIVYRKINRMPRYLAIAMLLMTVLFDWYGVLTARKRFHRQLPAERHRQIHLWKNSRLGVCRDFLQFYEKLVLYIYYSQDDPRVSLLGC